MSTRIEGLFERTHVLVLFEVDSGVGEVDGETVEGEFHGGCCEGDMEYRERAFDDVRSDDCRECQQE